ncbi:MAG: heme o synthase [Myxococcota bacterium]
MTGALGRAVDHLSLLKPRVTLLVVATAAAGMASAVPRPEPLHGLAVLLAIGLLAGSANALNCWLERDSDARMERTRRRALPAGRISPRSGLLFGLGAGALALAVLTAGTQPVTVVLGAVALGTYVGVYTPLKRVTPWALHIGAVPGALPALMGRTAVLGHIDAVGLALFSVLLLWQVPHFLAIAIRRRDEYARAGLRTVPVVQGETVARAQAFVAAAVLLPAGLLPAWLGAAGTAFAAGALVLGVALLALAARGLLRPADRRWPALLFGGSVAHLALYVLLFVVDVRPG